MIDDFNAVLPAADLEIDDEDRSRTPALRDPEEEAEWRSEFRSYLEDPV